MTFGSRRGFMKAASATAGAVALAGRVPAWAAVPEATSAGAPVRVWSSFRDKRHAQGEGLSWKAAGLIAADAIVLDSGTVKQEILGFGGAMTDATCYVLSQLSEAERGPIIRDLFAPEEMGFNVCRTCVGASDYSRTVYSFDESVEPDPEMKHFSIDHDREYILPVLREARKANKELFLFSSPWSPPGWMKANKSMLGGAMRSGNFEAYARYFMRFLEGYKAEGVAIDAVTVQNEVDAEQNGRMPACLWAQEHEIEFVAKFLGPALRKAGAATKIWVLDHNYNLWGRAIGELSNAEAAEYIDGIAWHGYVGEPSAMTRVHEAFPKKSAYWTEGGPDINAPDYETDYTKWGEAFNGILGNWARSITAWNVVLDEKGKPNVGPFSCGGVITVETGSHKVTRSGQYWAFAHYAQHMKRGARVIAANGIGGGEKGVTLTSVRNPDGGFVAVLANRGAERRVQLVMGGRELDVELPAESLQTLEWA
jgi:glucosylceramidase